MSPREPSGVQRAKKLHFQKPQKTFSFLVFLDPEASQENLKRPEKAPKRHPKRYQRWSKTWSKSGQKVKPKMSKKKTVSYLKKVALTGLAGAVF